MSSSHTSPYTEKAIGLCIALFGLMYLTLSFHTRLTLDDFHFMAQARELGIWIGMIQEYDSFNTRWAAVLFLHVRMALIAKFPFMIQLIPLLDLFAFVFSFRWLLNSMLAKNGRWQSWHASRKWMIIFYLTALMFFASIGIGETWFWITASSIYLWANIAWMLALAWILDERKNWTRSLITIPAMVFLGASSEPLVLFLLTALLFFFLVQWKQRKAKALPLHSVKKGLLAALLIGVAFLILLMGEGIEKRSNMFPEISVLGSFLLNVKMTAILLLKKLWPSILIFIIGLIPVLSWIQEVIKDQIEKVKWMHIILLYPILVFLFQWPITFATQDIGAPRTLFFLVIISLPFCVLFLLKVQTHYAAWITDTRLRSGLLALIIASLSVVLAFQFQTGQRYTSSYDARMEILKKGCEGKERITLPELPSSGLNYSAEIQKDSAHFSNQQLREYFKLSCEVHVLRKEN